MKIYELLETYTKEDEDYRGEHTAPSNNGYDQPMHNLGGIYPEDIYGMHAAQYYGDGSAYDNTSIAIIQGARNRPNKPIKIYRAVPHELTNDELIKKYQKEKAQIMRLGKVPAGVAMSKSAYYEFISNELERLANAPADTTKLAINPGDWVTTVKQYAIDHGRASLGNKYKVLSKTVKAKDLYTDGNSIHEWGYSP